GGGERGDRGRREWFARAAGRRARTRRRYRPTPRRRGSSGAARRPGPGRVAVPLHGGADAAVLRRPLQTAGSMTAFADPRFLLSAPPRSAVVLPGAEAWLPLLERAGIDLTSGPPVDVTLTGLEPAPGATEGSPAVIVEGEARLDGYESRRYVVFGSRDRPTLLVPRNRINVISYALSAWSAPRTRPRVLRAYLVARLPR